MSDQDALLDAISLLHGKFMLQAERVRYERILAHVRPRIIERNRRLQEAA